MRLVFITDIHDAFGSLEAVFENTTADLYVLAGDLVYRVFPRYEIAWRYMELQEILAGYRAERGAGDSLLDMARRLSREGETPQLRGQARDYMRLSDRAETYLQRSYRRMEEVLSRHSGKRIEVLPGNYDMDLRRTALKDRNLHLRCIEVDGWRIAGYGGAKVHTPGIPDHLRVPFNEGMVNGRLRSEAQEFFEREGPDILIIHHPAYGHLDRLPGHGHVGSPGIRNYLDKCRVALVLSGHMHEDWGAEVAEGLYYLNPSNFGRVVEVSGIRPGGYFFDLIHERGGLQIATLRQLDRGRIYDVVDYRCRDGGLETLVLDEERYVRMGGRLPRKRHIRPIRQYQRIKSFFLGYETEESRRLVRELRGIYRRIQKEGMNVAFDLLGSLNFGMAQKGSDLDLVVYLKGEECVPDEVDACAIPRPLAAVFEELRSRDLNLEVCDSLDLDRVAWAIQQGDHDDGHLQRFVFYRAVCRPVNLRLIKSVENQLLRKESLRRDMETRLREYLRILVSSVRHVRSFDKYMTRLREEGVHIPPDVEAGIRQYLRSR